VKQYQNPNDILNRMHARQYFFQGDPAVKFYSPTKPDYYLENNAVFVSTVNPTTALDSLKIGIIVKNKGKAIADSISLSIERTLKNSSKINYPIKRFKPIYNTDTLYFSIPTEGSIAEGNNNLKIKVDANEAFNELSEFNNIFDYSFYLPGNGINILYPKLNSIVDSTKINFQVQSSDLFTQSKNYIFEIDTVPDFTSAWKKNKNIFANALAKVSFDILPIHNQTYYWRAKLDLSDKEREIWQYGKF